MASPYTARVTIELSASVGKVWKAITDPQIVNQYFFDVDLVSDFQQGGQIILRGEWEGRKFEDRGVVLSVDEPELLSWSYWSSMSGVPNKPEHHQVVTYRIYEMDNSTQIELTHENLPSDAWRRRMEESWRQVLDGIRRTVG